MNGHKLIGDLRIDQKRHISTAHDEFAREIANVFGDHPPEMLELDTLTKNDLRGAVLWLRQELKKGHLETSETIEVREALRLIEEAFGKC